MLILHRHEKSSFLGGTSYKPFQYIIKDSFLCEYRIKARPEEQSPNQILDLTGCKLQSHESSVGNFTFSLQTKSGRTLFFRCPTESSRDHWLSLLSPFSSSSPAPSSPSIASSLSSSSLPLFSSTSKGEARTSGLRQCHSDILHSNLSPKPSRPLSETFSFSSSSSSSSSLNTFDQQGPLSSKSLGALHERREDLLLVTPSSITPSSIPSPKEVLGDLPDLDSFVGAVVVGSLMGVIVAVNSEAERLFGYKREELVGGSLSLLMPEPYKSQHDGYLFRHEKFGTEKLLGRRRELRGERKDGTSFPVIIFLGKLHHHGHFLATFKTP